MSRRVAAVFPLSTTVRYARNVAEALRTETVGGLIMLGATVLALIWANTPWADTYHALRETTIGPHAVHLSLSLDAWAADGLLAVFFFVAGLELREEVTHGELRRPRDAALPVFSAFGGVLAPVGVYFAVTVGEPGATDGWAIPAATDIAFALAVLAVTFSSCPASLRAFLLTLAVVDDLIAIIIIAIFYSGEPQMWALASGIVAIACYGLLQRAGIRSPWVYVPLGLLAWYLVHEAGIHATVAGVALGLLTNPRSTPADRRSPAERADHMLRPISAGIAVPIFAFLSAGVPLSGSALASVFTDRVALGVIAGLVIGKFVGILVGAWTAVRLGFARLGENLHWRELAAVAMLGGVGFTVSLLIGDLAYAGAERFERVATAILVASFVASAVAAMAFRVRVRQRARENVTGYSRRSIVDDGRFGEEKEMTETRPDGQVGEKSVGELVSLVTSNASRLIKSEIELAKLELKDDAKRAGLGSALFAVAAFLACLMLVMLSFAAAYGIATSGIPMWAAFLCVAAGWVLLAALLIGIGLLRLKRMTGIRRTRQTVKGDLAALRRSDGTGEQPVLTE